MQSTSTSIKVNKPVMFLLIGALAFFSLSAVATQMVTSNEYNFFKELYNPPPNTTITAMTRLDINEWVKKHPRKRKELIAFFSRFTKNDKISESILRNALEYNMPINFAFALSYVESNGFNIRAYNENKDGTIDRGLFQLNNGSRKNWKVKDFYDIEKNVHEGVRYWSEECIVKVPTISMSIIAYNMGPYSDAVKACVVPTRRADYVNDILEYEDMLNIEFNKVFS